MCCRLMSFLLRHRYKACTYSHVRIEDGVVTSKPVPDLRGAYPRMVSTASTLSTEAEAPSITGASQ
jgi:hypothetical protein